MNAQQVKRPLKALRAWPVLNLPVTTALRRALQLSGKRSSALARYLPRTGIVRASLPGGDELRLWSRADDQVASNVFWNGWGGHEPETTGPFYELAGQRALPLTLVRTSDTSPCWPVAPIALGRSTPLSHIPMSTGGWFTMSP